MNMNESMNAEKEIGESEHEAGRLSDAVWAPV